MVSNVVLKRFCHCSAAKESRKAPKSPDDHVHGAAAVQTRQDRSNHGETIILNPHGFLAVLIQDGLGKQATGQLELSVIGGVPTHRCLPWDTHRHVLKALRFLTFAPPPKTKKSFLLR